MRRSYYLGIDIGGSKIRGVLWDGRRASAAVEVATPRMKREFMRRLSSSIARLWRRMPGQIRGVGIGVAGRIRGTQVVSSRNISYLRDFDFKIKILPLPVPIRVDNDARAFARAEVRLGAGRRSRRMLAFTIGTGIGRAYAEKGRVKTVKRFEHPEPWERRYQQIRDYGNTARLATFLGKKLAGMIRRYRADTIVLGGGVLGRRGFRRRLASNLRAQGLKANVRRGYFGPNAAAIGAALLFRDSD